MLRESPQQRPNIYQVIRQVSLMRGTDIPIKDVSGTSALFNIMADSFRSILKGHNRRLAGTNICRILNHTSLHHL